ncbi:MAG: flagellar motor switch protein FliN [Chloroflexi bacterium RBG_16_57_9]|nr:MAG: flagellar motor switch protein FliN [Chloroflexi bacterium RBG_16_57_9]
MPDQELFSDEPFSDEPLSDGPGLPEKLTIQSPTFQPLPIPEKNPAGSKDLDFLADVDLHITVELGRAQMPVRDVLTLGPGSVVELDKLAGETVDILINGKLVGRGEVVVIDDMFGVRVTEIISPTQRWKY